MSDKKLGLCAEILCHFLTAPEHEGFVQALEDAVGTYGIDELMVHGWKLDDWVTYAGFDGVRQEVDAEALSTLRRQLQRFRRRGVAITLSGGGPFVPSAFFEVYPEARHVSNGFFWRFCQAKVEEAFQLIPEADAIELYLWESPLLNDRDFFREFHWAPTVADTMQGTDEYYGPADYLTQLFAAYGRGAAAAGKELTLLTFSHYPWQEQVLIEALQQLDPALPVRLDHKCQPGDWSPYRGPNNVMLAVTDRPATLLFDGAGEYWGQCLIPYCYPQEIQQRLWHALERNPSIDRLGMRVIWQHGHVFGAFNEVNFHALSRLARDPYTPIEEVWDDWTQRRFGAEAAPRVRAALERTNRIANLTYYIHGVWVHNHSSIADLPYLESHFLNYARSHMQWHPDDFRTRALLRELLEFPRQHTIDWVLADRQEALRLNRMSLDDVEAVRDVLPAVEYEKLRDQLGLQRAFIEVSLHHIEAFLRYRIEQQRPDPGNRERLSATLAALEGKAVEVEASFGEQKPILTARDIGGYVRQMRAAVPGLA